MTTTITDRISELSDAEQAYIARFIALRHPQIAEEAVAALAEYRRDYPESARVFLGAETNGGKR